MNTLLRSVRAISLVVLGAVLLFNPISLAVWSGLMFQRDFNAKHTQRGNDLTYATLCPIYRDMSSWERWTSRQGWKYGWCENYLDRI